MLKLSLRYMDSNVVSYRKTVACKETGASEVTDDLEHPTTNLWTIYSIFFLHLNQNSIPFDQKTRSTSVALVHSTSGINPPKFLFLCSHGNWKPFTREYCQFLMLCCRSQYSSQRQRVTSKSLSKVSFSTNLPVNKVPFLPTYSAAQLSVWKGGREKSCSVFTT